MPRKLKQTEPPTPPDKKSGFVAFFQELWKRLSGATPAFFKVIRNIAGILAAIAAVLKAVEESGHTIPHWLDPIASWVFFAAVVSAAIVAQLPTTDKDRKIVDGELPYTAKKISQGKEPLN